MRISKCTEAKEAWEILETTHEGTNTEIETIREFYAKIYDLTNKAFALGSEYSNSKLLRKVFKSLFERFNIKVTAIEETKDIDAMRIDELIGSLQTFETNLEEAEKSKLKPKKNITFSLAKTRPTEESTVIKEIQEYGCSCHIIGNLSCVSVIFYNWKKGKICGKGTLAASRMPNLKNVLYVNGIKDNLTNIGLLYDQGMLVNFVKDKCVVTLRQDEEIMEGVRTFDNCYKVFLPSNEKLHSKIYEILNVDEISDSSDSNEPMLRPNYRDIIILVCYTSQIEPKNFEEALKDVD
ncbi:hypothetical protein ES332_D09G068400v1 [Gossypium tomentosum]|uniref:Uncharacterized protein n=1 Tax=Gossypium tomentosum TaxID=34277 RepID=A0A5D2JF05_GOSTO|nr:hypothetical protein ES332_D09G068400v1 [Gossypium tomentosum]